MTRSEKVLVNSGSGLLLELVTFLSGIILPRLIIGHYGSEVNGLITSITQFLGYLTLLQSGVGGVVKAALYKPLEGKDTNAVSRIVKSTDTFFKRLAGVTVLYLAVLCVVFPFVVEGSFDTWYTVFMILLIGMTTLAQYLFGITYQLVLQADQRNYICNVAQIVTIIGNLAVSALLIFLGSSIHMVKLLSGFVFVLRPIAIHFYARKKYKIDTKVQPDNNAIKQRWYGVGFSVASFVHKKTDVFLLTIFSTLSNVSVYSVYGSVLAGIDSFISNLTGSFQAAFGNMLARDERENIKEKFDIYVFLSNVLVTVVFSVTFLQMIPFVRLYTAKVSDVNYIYPVFAFVISAAEMSFCLRQPYQAIITAAGHYKQTSFGAYLEAAINIVLSLALLKPLGLLGIAIGTLVSMVYRTVDYAV
ncbi:MAG: lipopolysaccharide biosynthesis protein, partial [Acutalibacteraceae bacterium]